MKEQDRYTMRSVWEYSLNNLPIPPFLFDTLKLLPKGCHQ